MEVQGSTASAGCYPMGVWPETGMRGGGRYGDTALAPRTTDFCADQVFDYLDPDSNVFVNFGDDVLRDSASLRRVGARPSDQPTSLLGVLDR